jgi:hypothetical protein
MEINRRHTAYEHLFCPKTAPDGSIAGLSTPSKKRRLHALLDLKDGFYARKNRSRAARLSNCQRTT